MADAVDDMIQETLLAVHADSHGDDAALPVTAWLVGMPREKGSASCAGAVAKTPSTIFDGELTLVAPADCDAAMVHRDRPKRMACLADRHRLPIVLTKIEGLLVEVAAQRARMSVAAVKVGVRRGLKALAAGVRDCACRQAN